MYILFVTVLLIYGNPMPAVTTAEFNNQQACLSAAISVMAHPAKTPKGELYIIDAFCLPKD